MLIPFLDDESPSAPVPPTSRGQISWSELEVPALPSPTRGQISWTELEIPNLVIPTRGQISHTEFECPPISFGVRRVHERADCGGFYRNVN